MVGEVKSYQNLWRAVLVRQIQDAVRPRWGQHRLRSEVSAEAKAWVKSAGFLEVCEMAGFEGKVLRPVLLRFFDSPDPAALLDEHLALFRNRRAAA